MERKLVKQGNGALTITLPYLWIEKNNLQRGDYVNLTESGKDLFLSSRKGIIDSEAEIRISEETPFFKRYLRTSYILGHNKIVLVSDSALPYSQIKEAISDLLGYEIIEQSAKRCVISVMAEEANESLEATLRRIFFMVGSQMTDIITSLEENKLSDLASISEAESSVNRLVDFSLRILNKKGHTDFKKTPYIYQVLISLEGMADHLKVLCLSCKKTSKELIGCLSILKSYFEEIMRLFYKYDMKKIKKTKEKRQNLYLLVASLPDKNKAESLPIYAIISLLHQLEIALDPISR
jgi:phosphate uptake regulator